MTQYRAVCLEEVGLKLTASIMLARLSVEVGESHACTKVEDSGGFKERKGKESSSQDGLFANRTGHRELRPDSEKVGQLGTIAMLSEL